jgi:hypothetical protein
LIVSATVFSRFVLHDLRLSARGLASMFGSLSPGRLGAFAALLFVAFHAAAWPVAGWLIDIEDGPNGPARVLAILASGAILIFPWIVAQSMTEFTRTFFGRSDFELILSSPVDARSLLAARASSIALGAIASVGILLAPLADAATLRGHAHWLALYPTLLAAGLRGDRLRRHARDGSVSGGGATPCAPLQPDRSDDCRRLRCAWSASCRHASGRDADFDPRDSCAARNRDGRREEPPVDAGASRRG